MNECDGKMTLRASGAMAIIVALGLVAPSFASCRYVAFGWELSQLKIPELLSAAESFDETPLDGVGFSPLMGLPDASGRPMWSRYLMHDGPWRFEDMRSLVPDLRRLTAHRSMKECFFKSFCVPTNRIAWTDDTAWGRIAANMGAIARLAKEGGVRGLGVDHEDYFRQEQFRRRSSDPAYPVLAELVRRRGREVFAPVFREHPSAKIITFWLLSEKRDYFAHGDVVAHCRDTGDLWPAFVNGILDVLPPEATIIDGDEKSYRYRGDRRDFALAHVQQRTRAIRLVAPENRVKYRSQASMASSIYLDMYLAKEDSRWYMPPLDGSRLKRLESNLAAAAYASDGYVWFWGEAHCWAKWPHARRFNGHFRQEDFKRTWEECLPGLCATIASTKDPTGYGLDLWRRCREREGGLKPINANPECRVGTKPGVPAPYATWQDTYRRDTNGVFAADSAFGEGDSSSIRVTGVSCGSVILPMKGVKPGEWYGVEFSAFGEGVSGSVGWYVGGKWMNGDAASALVVFDEPERQDKWRRARTAFRVPDGADGFGLIMGVHLMPGESCWLDNVRVFKLKDNSESAKERQP